ncbi:pseudouridine synthase [Lasiosphaeria hispida]|uniref:Pseudouridine synthase n=1 Tax=Lasiosphaeria hispida TaxID=260671 RepID=A0AAJ0MFW6_9PEZI|nr:pseudouridine synthase [Lasiosphaeria hispida]
MSRREGTHVPAVRAANEKNLGITQRCAPINFAWIGDVRKRYTDFLVFEICKDGSVVHLCEYEVDEEQEKLSQNFAAQGHPGARNFTSIAQPNSRIPPAIASPAEKPSITLNPVSAEDRMILEKLLQEDVTAKLIKLDENVQSKKSLSPAERAVTFNAITDRTVRSTVHQEIRRIFGGRIETLAANTGVITATPARFAGGNRHASQGPGPRRDNNNRPTRGEQGKSFTQLGGDYLHFTLYKENKDTMDAINTIARLVKIKASNFGFAGTKDRRAATVQRISVYRQRASNIIWLNSRLPNVKVGDFKHSKSPLQLGQHGGNEFIITLKNCQPIGVNPKDVSVEQRMKMIQASVECGLAYLRHHGYLNYFGLQRFGTYSIGTHSLGMKVLKGDFEGVIDDILLVDAQFFQEILENKSTPVNDNNRDDLNRARAITMWKATKNADKALELLPKRFSSEYAIIRHLSRSPKDFMGAMLAITRGMRMMYIHAYQSFVWNFVLTHRWSKYGATVIVGDLVLLDDKNATPVKSDPEDVDAAAVMDEDFYAQAYALTAEDVASGKYTIFDVVLPTPGWDVMYPRNDIGDYYAEFMGKEENGGLNPYDMRRRQKEFSLSGSYRHIIGRFIIEPEYAIRLYHDDTQQLYPTDLDFANHNMSMKKIEAAKTKAKAQIVTETPVSPLPEVLVAKTDESNLADNSNTVGDRRRKASDSPATETSDKRAKFVHHNSATAEAKLPGIENAVPAFLNTTPRAIRANGSPSFLNTTPMAIGTNTRDVSPLSPLSPRSPRPFGKTTLSSASQALAAKLGMPADFDEAVQSMILPDDSPKVRTVSEQYYASIGKNPLNMSPMATVPEKSASVFAAPVDPATPVISTVADGEPSVEAVDTQQGGAGVTKIGNITLPTFCTPSENPIMGVCDLSQELINNPKAKKIAVILKFQLKTSNYATIVLRELMGTNAEDSIRASEFA